MDAPADHQYLFVVKHRLKRSPCFFSGSGDQNINVISIQSVDSAELKFLNHIEINPARLSETVPDLQQPLIVDDIPCRFV